MITGGRRRAAASHRVPAQLSVRAMAKKGRVARILTTLHRVAGTPISEALKRRQRSATQRGDAGTHGEKSEWKKRKERKARREAFEGAATQTGLPHGYHAGQRILCVGEGNFSFALALTTLFDGEGVNVLATSFDKTGVARASYRDAKDIAHALEATGAGVRHGVDVQEIDALKLVAKEWWAMGNDPEYAADRERGGGREGRRHRRCVHVRRRARRRVSWVRQDRVELPVRRGRHGGRARGDREPGFAGRLLQSRQAAAHEKRRRRRRNTPRHGG